MTQMWLKQGIKTKTRNIDFKEFRGEKKTMVAVDKSSKINLTVTIINMEEIEYAQIM